MGTSQKEQGSTFYSIRSPLSYCLLLYHSHLRLAMGFFTWHGTRLQFRTLFPPWHGQGLISGPFKVRSHKGTWFSTRPYHRRPHRRPVQICSSRLWRKNILRVSSVLQHPNLLSGSNRVSIMSWRSLSRGSEDDGHTVLSVALFRFGPLGTSRFHWGYLFVSLGSPLSLKSHLRSLRRPTTDFWSPGLKVWLKGRRWGVGSYFRVKDETFLSGI